ncbi:MAG: c-type cytochrome [Gammaproteobacteria bacterium]|nr:c-type cytochrome [Gammaproteobacteria bacterium]MDH5345327.1 c-type cytochrome [Gammaproteobacteria bacterium]
MTKLTLFTGAIALVTASIAIGQGTGDVVRGKKAYYDQACYACHGYQGIGRRNVANRASGVLVNEQVFLLYLRARADQNPDLSTQTMPHYPASSLPDDVARDIYAYILTFVDDPPEVGDIPVLQAILDDAETE